MLGVTDDAGAEDSEDLAVDADSKTYDAEFLIAVAGSRSGNTGCQRSVVKLPIIPVLDPGN